MTPNGWAVEVENLVKRFGTFAAVDNISLRVRRGEIFGFLGPNGAGEIDGHPHPVRPADPHLGHGQSGGHRRRARPRGHPPEHRYMSQKFSLYDDLTVEENLDFFGGVYGVPAERRHAREEFVLRMAGLTEQRSRMTRLLAGGWKQRLALGCAILHEPPILFLDEPTSGVDPIARREFWDLIYQLSEDGHTIFVTTHYMDEAEYCHRLALMYKGKIIAMDTPAALMQAAGKGSMEEVFVSMIEEEERNAS